MTRTRLVASLILVLALSGCSAAGNDPTETPVATTPAVKARGGIVNPLAEITDKADSRFVASHITPILDASGVGPHSYTLGALHGTNSVRVYVACAPDSNFSVTLSKGFSGPCAGAFENYADIPLDGARSVRIDVPSRTRFSMLIISSPHNP